MVEVQFKKLDERATIPRNAYGNDAGWDLFACEGATITEGQGKDIRTGIAIALPDGYFARIVARSSTMRKRGLLVLEGIIDAGFRGELFSYAYLPVEKGRLSETSSVFVMQGDSIAQLIVQEVRPVRFQEVDELPASLRGERGFGSSGS